MEDGHFSSWSHQGLMPSCDGSQVSSQVPNIRIKFTEIIYYLNFIFKRKLSVCAIHNCANGTFPFPKPMFLSCKTLTNIKRLGEIVTFGLDVMAFQGYVTRSFSLTK